jgi:beta-glucosidase
MKTLLTMLLGAVVLTFAPAQTPIGTDARLPDTVVPAQDLAPMKASSYNWWKRHDGVIKRLHSGKVDLLLIGDSITHMWGGEPTEEGGGPGNYLWQKYYGSRNAVNEGFGWDRTQHVLWRFDHGELDGIHPKVAVIMIGTNNIGFNKTPDIVAGVQAIVDQVHAKLPGTKILLLAIFPRDPSPTSQTRIQIAEVNKGIAKIRGVTFLDIGTSFLQPDGTLTREIMPDYLHPSPKGFQIWATAMEPTLSRLMRDKPRT